MSEGIYNRYTGYHNRRSIRLKGWDYARPGFYFITICIHDRKQKLFGDVVDGKMVLNDPGKYANQCWLAIPAHFPQIKLDEYIIMPNHIHGIIVIRDLTGPVGANNHSPRQNHSPLPRISKHSRQPKNTHIAPFRGTLKTTGSVVRGFKIGVTKWFRQTTPDIAIWQRNYHDHIIRDEKSLFYIRKYIRKNPSRWSCDSENHLSIEEKEIREYFKGPEEKIINR